VVKILINHTMITNIEIETIEVVAMIEIEKEIETMEIQEGNFLLDLIKKNSLREACVLIVVKKDILLEIVLMLNKEYIEEKVKKKIIYFF
jgi:hypothetical protein